MEKICRSRRFYYYLFYYIFQQLHVSENRSRPPLGSSLRWCCKVHFIDRVQLAGKVMRDSVKLVDCFTVVVSTPLILYGCCWPIWRPFVSTTKQNQQHNRAQLYNALWVKHETPWCWNPALGSQPWLFQLSIIYYVSAHWKRMWSQVCSPKSPRSKLPHIGKLLFP